jgi:hypothetical protein
VIRTITALATLVVLGACAARVAPPPVVATLPPPPPPPELPDGAATGMTVPERLADGSFPTPNRGLSPAGALWHLRSGLNVAALACRGPDEAALVAGYNALLRTREPALAAAETALIAEYRARVLPGEAAGTWRRRYDEAMTRLYNYWAIAPARVGLCAASAGVLAEMPAVAAAGLTAAAPGWLARMDRPVTDFYAAFDAWRRALPGGPAAVAAPVRTVAVPASAASGPGAAAVPVIMLPPAPVAAPAPPRPAPPVLTVDPSVFR